jgi:hypothetical protein
MKFKCEGPVPDDTGALYCPFEPENEAYDCVHCRAVYDHWEELMADADREEGKDTWG